MGTLVRRMTLTEEGVRTPFYDKVNEYATLQYSKHSYRQDEYNETNTDVYKLVFNVETIFSLFLKFCKSKK